MAKAKPEPLVETIEPNTATKRAAIQATCGGWDTLPDSAIVAKWANTTAEDRAEMLRVLSDRGNAT